MYSETQSLFMCYFCKFNDLVYDRMILLDQSKDATVILIKLQMSVLEKKSFSVSYNSTRGVQLKFGQNRQFNKTGFAYILLKQMLNLRFITIVHHSRPFRPWCQH